MGTTGELKGLGKRGLFWSPSAPFIPHSSLSPLVSLSWFCLVTARGLQCDGSLATPPVAGHCNAVRGLGRGLRNNALLMRAPLSQAQAELSGRRNISAQGAETEHTGQGQPDEKSSLSVSPLL